MILEYPYQLSVFSTLVEVFPATVSTIDFIDCLLHARGGVSGVRSVQAMGEASSPRSWRCFCSKS